MDASGEQLKLDGMTIAAEAVPDWTATARGVIIDLPPGARIDSEYLTARCGMPRGDVSGANRNNAVGAMFSWAARAGLLHRVGDRNATRAVVHAARIGVWERTNRRI